MAQIASTNVSMDTIKNTLTSGGGSVSNDLLTFFTSNAKINIWSKWKPILIPADFVDNESTMKEYDWGITIPSTTNLTTAYNGSSISDWNHKLPTGGSSGPYRLGDFRNYRSDATSPFKGLEVMPGNSYVPGDTATVTLYCRMFNDSNEAGMLGLNDLGTLSNCQCAFIKRSPSGTLTQQITSATIDQNHGSISITFPKFTTSDYGTHTFTAALYKNGTYYPLPITKKSVVVERPNINTTFTMGSASIESSGFYASCTLTWGTQESSSITTSVTFELTDKNHYTQQTFQSTQSQTAQPGDTVRFTCDRSRSELYSYCITLAERGELMCRATFNGHTTGYVYVNYF